jgi:multidrug transporter EmrE-like cation transporter
MNDWLALYMGIVLTVCAQLMLRKGARLAESYRGSLMHPLTVLGYSFFLVTTLLNVFALRTIELKSLTAWASLTYALTPIGARIFLAESLPARSVLGALLVSTGLLIFSHGA